MATLEVAVAEIPFSPALSKWQTRSFERVCHLFLWLAITAYVLLTLHYTFFLHDKIFGFQTGFDLAIFDQATWLISRGHTPFVTIRGVHILADHFSIILYLLAPLYWLWDSPKVLLTVQTVALALGALPIYALARQKTGWPLAGLLFAVSYLLYPMMQWANTYEFHPDTLATPALLAAFYFLTQKQWGWYFAMLGLAALTKESVGLTVVMFGFYALFVNRRIGWLTIGFGVTSVLVALATVRYFNEGVPSGYYWLYRKYGDNLPAMAGFMLQNPLTVLADLGADLKRQYLIDLLQPLLFLPLLAPEVLLIAAPALLSNMLSSRSIMHSLLGGYYSATVMPFLFMAAIVGYSRLQKRIGSIEATVLVVNVCIWSLVSTAQGPLWKHYRSTQFVFQDVEERERQLIAETRRILQAIPPRASVSAQVTLVSHLSHRQNLYTFPNPFLKRGWGNTVQARLDLETGMNRKLSLSELDESIRAATIEYIVLSPTTSSFPISHETFVKCSTILLGNSSYGIIALGKGTILLRRGADYQQGLRLLQRRSATTINGPQHIQNAFLNWIANPV